MGAIETITAKKMTKFDPDRVQQQCMFAEVLLSFQCPICHASCEHVPFWTKTLQARTTTLVSCAFTSTSFFLTPCLACSAISLHSGLLFCSLCTQVSLSLSISLFSFLFPARSQWPSTSLHSSTRIIKSEIQTRSSYDKFLLQEAHVKITCTSSAKLV